jgi:hypothetical protein
MVMKDGSIYNWDAEIVTDEKTIDEVEKQLKQGTNIINSIIKERDRP